MDRMNHIKDLRFKALDVPMLEPFGIATGTQDVARNVLVEIELEDGTCGLGEAAPFPAVNGETQSDVLAALPAVASALIGQSLLRLRPLAALARAALPHTPSAVAAVDMALVDAWTKRAQMPMWSFFGGAQTSLRTDITIVTGSVAHAVAAADRAVKAGFDVLKMKIGGTSVELDLARIRAIATQHAQVKFILDANASLSASLALTVLKELGSLRERVVLFEQPTPTEDLDQLGKVSRDGGVKVAADESARCVADVVAIASANAAGVINIKTMKAGLFEAWDMMVTARAMGLELMVGGMVETELAMTVSACLGGGFGGVLHFDLDTPLFLGPRPLVGGFRQNGPHIDLLGVTSGHGVACE